MLPASPANILAGSRILAQVVAKVSGGLVAAVALAGLTLPVAAQELKYDVRIDAPGPLRELLEQNLDLVRFRGNARMDREQLQRLVRVAPEQVKTLVSTDGYYSPEVSARLERKSENNTPTWQITGHPGEPERVGDI